MKLQMLLPQVTDVEFLVGVAVALHVPVDETLRNDLNRVKLLIYACLMNTDQMAAEDGIMDRLYGVYDGLVNHLNPEEEEDDLDGEEDDVLGAVGGHELLGRGRGIGRGSDSGLTAPIGHVGRINRGHVGLGGVPPALTAMNGVGRGGGGGGGAPPALSGMNGVGRGGLSPQGFPGTGRGRGIKTSTSPMYGQLFSTPTHRPTAAGAPGAPGGGGGFGAFRRLRDFKIHGQIGIAGQTDKLTFGNLLHQIWAGHNQGYGEQEIIAAVIRAIVPGLALRSYLEGRHDWTLPAVMTVLRTHYKEKDATAVFNEMNNASQEKDETEHGFVVRMMGLRDRVMWLTFEEGGLYDARLVQAQFQHGVHTGLRSDEARHELRSILRRPDVADNELLVLINEFMMNSVEHRSKTKDRSNADVNSVQSAGGGGTSSRSRADNKAANKEKENTLLAKMNSHADQVNELTAKVNQLTTLVTNFVGASGAGRGGGPVAQNGPALAPAVAPGAPAVAPSAFPGAPGGMFVPWGAPLNYPPPPQRRRFGLCPTCAAANAAQCPHCFKCGATDHQKADCPN